MLLDEIHRKRDTIARLCQQYGARRLRVFGSVARREERIDSDVDFLVDFPRGYDLFAQRLPLAEKLSQLAVNYTHALRTRPLTLEIMAWEMVESDRVGRILAHMHAEVRRQLALGMDRADLISAARTFDLDDLVEVGVVVV